jgi:hypothetical protein
MITVNIHCEHSPTDIQLRISENNLCCIQCGLVQIALSHAQATRVRRHCHCMAPKLQEEQRQRQAYMTIDPSQLDLRGRCLGSWLMG